MLKLSDICTKYLKGRRYLLNEADMIPYTVFNDLLMFCDLNDLLKIEKANQVSHVYSDFAIEKNNAQAIYSENGSWRTTYKALEKQRNNLMDTARKRMREEYNKKSKQIKITSKQPMKKKLIALTSRTPRNESLMAKSRREALQLTNRLSQDRQFNHERHILPPSKPNYSKMKSTVNRYEYALNSKFYKK
ncbi:hypothetical protein ROZALSC1DRAFT_30090 [Rozella allomycis CSF55]|uniref:Elongin-A n=1 Tax=Rozella allomycis (strain CSF55) TaxID=988480 RepID=A0A075AQC4_ROZAC|nr:hypothetical protein O9G_002797 [Rozella allomycis CSF55]RKP18187.1 hypothetical protein ROZALSC1DRAFT_30090 [Rozella allomycis CSF55]|eukprot:EPZ30920.1 hypothetical protein O9G_002797 [Rozella allomycis CSF55]